MMKKTILLAMLCIFSSLGTRAGDYNYLVFTHNGSTTAVTASSLTITFSDGYLYAKNSSGETLATILLTDLTKMEFSNDDPTGIESISADRVITDDATVIYDMNGRQVSKDAALPKGVYIVKNSNKTFKMYIK